jgi:hypothetical protein
MNNLLLAFVRRGGGGFGFIKEKVVNRRIDI